MKGIETVKHVNATFVIEPVSNRHRGASAVVHLSVSDGGEGDDELNLVAMSNFSTAVIQAIHEWGGPVIVSLDKGSTVEDGPVGPFNPDDTTVEACLP